MKSVMNWMAENWGLISLVLAPLLISLLNKLTNHYSKQEGLVKALTWVTELLGFFTSKDVPGWLKRPLKSVSPDTQVNLEEAKDNVGKTLLVLAISSALLLQACGTVQTVPRDGLGASQWTFEQCRKAQNKRDLLLGITAGLAVAGGAGGISAIIPDDKNWKLGMGITSAVLALGAAVLAPFTSSAQKNLSDHCADY